MNYPLQSLVIIAPIIFLVLMIVTPVIGVFAGWKRAAYWGGGTFFFFAVGLIVWQTAGAQIFSALKPLISSLLENIKKGITISDDLIKAVTAPVFFIGVMAIAELILLINYYAWFKRVAKIKQDVKLKKEIKAAKKAGKKMPKISGSAWTQMQFTTKGKVINMACGGAGLALLLAPTTVTFTQAVYYLTTSPTTRANNAFANGLYNSLQKTGSAFSWMSYYGGTSTGDAFNSAFSLLELSNGKSTFIDEATGEVVEGYKVVVQDPTTGETTIEVRQGSTITALGDIASSGFTELMKKATTTTTDPDDQTTSVVNTVNKFAESWNSLMQTNGTAVSAVFGSTEIVTTLKDTLVPSGSSLTLASGTYDQLFGSGSTFEKMIDSYSKGQIEIKGEKVDIDQLTTIPVSQASFDSICDSLKTSLVNDSGLTNKQKEDFDGKFEQIMLILFSVANKQKKTRKGLFLF